MASISERIKEGLSIRNMKQSELVEKTKIGKSSISTYISGAYEPKQKNIYKIAKALDVSETWLMGLDVPIERTSNIDSQSLTEEETTLLNSYSKLNTSGKDEAIKRVDELTYIDKYSNPNMMTLDEAKEYLKNYQMAAYGGEDFNKLTDEQIIDRAMALKHEFEEVPHKYKK